ncbi:hypothetical protein [Actinokineospora fastidiosa]|uniref:Uncharacterized protein n=1 Tax=Actinokineospora fastidiosa TaxID=1816 RepID=A0A918GT56_9PSEU|nr:hypothetical protein [Actinokineospora fastidiosa]GGS59689.1 hypothetical protein GCM10010171_63330 [Actinokineospora fastidiosa]
MATPEEIRRRVELADTNRSARRAAAAQQVGELAQRRAAIVGQLEDIERELGDVLAEAQDVIGVEELAEFTDLKASDLTGWLAGCKATRGKRKKAPSGSGTHSNARRTSGPRTPVAEEATTPREEATAAGAVERLVAQAS